MTKRFGFTLAEVLITLGIIGVVAAMTMPTLMNSTQGAQYKTAFKKALSALSQAVTLNMALDDWNFADVTAGTGVGESDQTVRKILTTRMNVVKDEDVTGNSEGKTDGAYIANAGGFTANKTGLKEIGTGYRRLSFADGITFYYNPTEAAACTDTAYTGTETDRTNATNRCYGVVDVNGEKGPNKYVTCDDSAANIMDSLTTAADDRSDTDKAKTCTVTNPTDIYPVYFYDQTVVPASAAAKAVLYGK